MGTPLCIKQHALLYYIVIFSNMVYSMLYEFIFSMSYVFILACLMCSFLACVMCSFIACLMCSAIACLMCSSIASGSLRFASLAWLASLACAY